MVKIVPEEVMCGVVQRPTQLSIPYAEKERSGWWLHDRALVELDSMTDSPNLTFRIAIPSDGDYGLKVGDTIVYRSG